MRINIRLIICIILFNFFSENLFSQIFTGCTNYTTQNPATIDSISVNTGFQTISNCMKGGNYAVCFVELGNIYTWTTCLDSGNFNSQLTLFNGSTFADSVQLAYSDNVCNAGSQLVWLATFTGYVKILVNKKMCQTTPTKCVNLSWKAVYSNCNNPIELCKGTNIFPVKTGQLTTYDPYYSTNNKTKWGCGANQTIVNQDWFYFKATQSGNIDLQLTSTSTGLNGLLWGPIDSLNLLCQAMLNEPLACNFNLAQSFNLSFTSAIAGKYYVIMTSNPSNTLTNINMSFMNTAGGKMQLCQPILSYNQPLCINDNLQLFATSTETGGSYFWTGPNNFYSTNQNPVINNISLINSGVYTCYYTTTYGISTTNSINVGFLPKPITSYINHN